MRTLFLQQMNYYVNWHRIGLIFILVVQTGFYSLNLYSQKIVRLSINALPIKASIGIPGENDLYSFETDIRMGGTYTVQTYGKMDSYMYLYKLDGNTPIVLKEDDNSGIDNNAMISMRQEARMTYYIRIKSNSSNNLGTYYINVVREPYLQPPVNLTGIGSFISASQGSVTLSWEAPWSEITPVRYRVYKSTAESGPFSRISETTNRHIKYTLPRGSNFWYYVTAVYPRPIGVSVQSNKVNVNADATILIDDGSPKNASIYTPGQEDWYRFYIPNYSLPVYVYEISVHGTSGPMDMLAYLYDSDMTTLYDKDENTNPYFDANLIGASYLYDKWLYIKVKANTINSATGSYGISVRRLPLEENANKDLLVNAPPFEGFSAGSGGSTQFLFKSSESGTYTIQTHGNLKTTLNLYAIDDNGHPNIIEQSQGNGEGQNALISRDLTPNTQYMVGFTGYFPQNVPGDYSIEVNGPISSLVVDDPYKSNCRINIAGETDWYKFKTGATSIYTIRQFVNAAMIMSLYQNDQITLIAQDGDMMSFYQSIEINLSPNTWYYVRLRSVGRYTCCYYYGVGVYTGPNVTLTLNAVATDAVIDGPGEMDWYSFQTGAAGNYTIETYGNLDTFMSIYNHLYGPASPLIDDDNSGTNNNAKITQSLNANTWYFIKIRGSNSNLNGSYSIDVQGPM
jgi:hypothetical protein